MESICYLIDLDGTIYRGNELIHGAQPFLRKLSEKNSRYKFITNNSSRTPSQLSEKLAGMGIDEGPAQFITTALATADYLKNTYQKEKCGVLVIGEDGLFTAIREAGFTITHENPEIVVIGLDRNFNSEKLTRAVKAIQNGAAFIATNPDKLLLTEEGLVPGTGSMVAKVENETGIEPIFIGKPYRYLFEYALRALDMRPEGAIMIGDNYNTDIVGAQKCGLLTALVLTGITKREELSGKTVLPHYVVRDLEELMVVLGL